MKAPSPKTLILVQPKTQNREETVGRLWAGQGQRQDKEGHRVWEKDMPSLGFDINMPWLQILTPTSTFLKPTQMLFNLSEPQFPELSKGISQFQL